MTIPYRVELTKETSTALEGFRNAREILKRAMLPQLAALGGELKGKMAPETPRDTGALVASNRFTVLADEIALLLFNARKYSIYVHHGTHHTKMPPVDALLQWARRRVINTHAAAKASRGVTTRTHLTAKRRDEAYSFAWLIARAIKARGGLKPRPWMANTIDANRSAIRNAVERGQKVFVELLRRGSTG